MVEGMVVMSVMVGFLGLIMGAKSAYEAKLYRQQGTRATTLYLASHACEDNGGGGYTGPGSATASSGAGEGGDVQQAPGATNVPPARSTGTSTTKWNSAKTTDHQDMTWTWVADQNASNPNSNMNFQRKSVTTTVDASSFSVCNEKDYRNSNFLSDMFSYGKSLITSGGGFPWGN
jgi:hypothetical protein